MGLFRYSGNKGNFPRLDLSGYGRVVELFAGSCGFSTSHRFKSVLAIDCNSEITALLKWLKTKPDLQKLVKYQGTCFNIAELPDLLPEEKTYLRVNIASVCVGQLSSWFIYPQHTLPVEETERWLDLIQGWKFICGDYTCYRQQADDLVFIDPPYLGTCGNYGGNGFNESGLVEWVKGLDVDWIMTYGSSMAGLEGWERYSSKWIPNFRVGGSVLRSDWVTDCCGGNLWKELRVQRELF